MLSESDERTLRMSELAAPDERLALTAVARDQQAREARAGWPRAPSPESRRVTLVPLTEEGSAVLVAAAPGHVETVR